MSIFDHMTERTAFLVERMMWALKRGRYSNIIKIHEQLCKAWDDRVEDPCPFYIDGFYLSINRDEYLIFSKFPLDGFVNLENGNKKILKKVEE